MTSQNITITPWQHESELAMVREWFFPQQLAGDPYISQGPNVRDNRQAAIYRVDWWAWRTPSTPHAVLATASLMSAKLHDENGFTPVSPTIDLLRPPNTTAVPSTERPFSLSEHALKSIYAMSFCRFVNGFVDRDVIRATRSYGLSQRVGNGNDKNSSMNDDMTADQITKGAGESSMYANAVTIGMPSSFVDFRHRCTHGKAFPTLHQLRSMNDLGLEWLRSRWWKVNAVGDPSRAIWEHEEADTRTYEAAHKRGQKRKLEDEMESAVARKGAPLSHSTPPSSSQRATGPEGYFEMFTWEFESAMEKASSAG